MSHGKCLAFSGFTLASSAATGKFHAVMADPLELSNSGHYKAAEAGSVNTPLTMLPQNLCHFWISVMWLCDVFHCAPVLRNLLSWIYGTCVPHNGLVMPLANGTKLSSCNSLAKLGYNETELRKSTSSKMFTSYFWPLGNSIPIWKRSIVYWLW